MEMASSGRIARSSSYLLRR
ncbi:hypothetical protein TOPH_08170 [Tolypocladium ophioglossoides CBS 100239]|uniref:Uncharacterized protein n=1 Tax=Tolypocladium ophioglossoides (strain CBS 100239) TaxID=1163406 RepID=A0A0L0MZA3_TOLOC|nr:hypothetical protein TOPH_08170 [Tolypocladium ophioglossoides CBS 100239]